MGGWIKVEKDLRQDPRVLRMARAVEKNYRLFPVDEPELDPCNAVALPAVTLVLGALNQLWMYADSYARDDDTLDLGPDEINELTGIKGFAELMPADWLEILDSQSVKLPGFHTHNGTDAKRKAVTALRVSRHRSRMAVTSVTRHALPDQDRDHTKTKTIKNGGAASPLVLNGHPDKAAELALHTSLPLDAWDEWIAHRRKRKWSTDHVTLRKQLNLLVQHATEEQRSIIDNSIQAGWQGLFPPKGKHQKKHVTAMSTAEAEALEAARGR